MNLRILWGMINFIVIPISYGILFLEKNFKLCFEFRGLMFMFTFVALATDLSAI